MSIYPGLDSHTAANPCSVASQSRSQSAIEKPLYPEGGRGRKKSRLDDSGVVAPSTPHETDRRHKSKPDTTTDTTTTTFTDETGRQHTHGEDPEAVQSELPPPYRAGGANDDGNTTATTTNTTTTTKWQASRIIVGSLCLTIPTFGLMSAWGLFQVYWQEHQLSSYSAPQVAWIGSVFGFLDCFLGLICGMALDKWGARAMLPAGCIVYWVCFLALAWCETYGALMACFAVAGVSAAIPTVVAFCVIDDWFTAHRAAAMGVVSTGAPVGGIIFSLALRALFGRYEWSTSMFCLSSVIGCFLLVGTLLVKSRRHPGAVVTWDLEPFKDAKFLLFTFCVFVFEFVLYTQWGSLPVFAALTSLGDVFLLQMTYNIGAIVGRTIPPWQAVRWGPFNLLLVMTLLTLLTMFAIWIPFGSMEASALYVVAFFMGIGTGSFVPLSATCLSRICSDRGYGKWLGSCYAIVSFASLIGNPINQAILERAGPRISVAFQGVLLVVAFAVALVVRWICLGGRRQSRVFVKV